jgi:protein-S-isoprenylcysteine O-methyltransferase Ste14
MSAGFILWILGWGLFQGALASLSVGSLSLISIAWWGRLEDRELESCYGGEYEQYRARTWV